MEEIEDHRHIETRERLCDAKTLPAYIPSMPHVQTIQTIDPEQNSTYHRRTPHQGTGRLSTWKVMYKSTVESDSTHRRWLPGRKDHGNRFCGPVLAYNTVNHRLLIQKLYSTTQDSKLCRVIQNLLSNRRFYVELNKERSRWRKQKNGLPQGSVLAPTLFNIYTNDQPIHYGTRSFIYADDLCITAQYQSFKQVEKKIEEALDSLTAYYQVNSLRANPEKNISHCIPSQE